MEPLPAEMNSYCLNVNKPLYHCIQSNDSIVDHMKIKDGGSQKNTIKADLYWFSLRITSSFDDKKNLLKISWKSTQNYLTEACWQADRQTNR